MLSRTTTETCLRQFESDPEFSPDELGSVREIISRILKQFEERGWVLPARRKIQVLEPDQLKAYADGAR